VFIYVWGVKNFSIEGVKSVFCRKAEEFYVRSEDCYKEVESVLYVLGLSK
jgi:hypothetical protein